VDIEAHAHQNSLLAAIPTEHFLFAAAALALVGAGDGVEELVIAGDAAAILGRAAPFAAAKVGIDYAGFGGLNPLDDDTVLPVVAHVIGVIEGSDPALDETG
jgi:hypothetical protein